MDNKQIDKIMRDAIRFIIYPDNKNFGEVALGLYDLHRELNPVYERYSIGELTDWREIPLMPINEFKKHDVGITLSDRMPFPGIEFHSSGTTQGDKSMHRMYDTEAYRCSIQAGFKRYVDVTPFPKYRVVMLSPVLPNSSLYYMMVHVSALHDRRGFTERFEGMNSPSLTNTLLDSLREETDPVLLFGTSLAYYDLMETINSSGHSPVKLPEGSIFIETGGWKGRDIKITPDELTANVGSFFGIDRANSIREYSMSEISSQLYSTAEQKDVSYLAPEHLNVRLVDPLTQTEVPHGETGIIAFVDLANVWSCPFILTEDLGHFYTMEDGTEALVLEGRAVNAPEKGCSLTYAEAMDN